MAPGPSLKGQGRAARVILLSALAAGAAVAAAAAVLTTGNAGRSTHVDGTTGGPWAAPYFYLGASGPPAAEIMQTTGVRRLTVAFVVSDGTCNPVWDGGYRLAGGAADAAIRGIRAAGGEVAVSFGGMGGTKLGLTCSSPEALAGAYQKVIAAYRLPAIDVDVEDAEIGSAAVRQRVVSALALVRREDPGLWISVTMGAARGGPDAAGRDLIGRAAAAGLRVNAWTIMPFDFPAPKADMGRTSIQAAEGLKAVLMSAYREPAAAAYQTMGISSMNGRTDAGETVTVSDFQAIVRYSRAHHLARLSFWSVNRDRPCTAGTGTDSCSGIDQAPYAFTRVIAGYRG